MTNAEIILMEQATRDIEEPLHTFQMWKKLGYKVKKGEHGIETRLWKMKNSKNQKEQSESDADGEQNNSYFFLAKSYLFKLSQVEKIEAKV